MQTLSNRLWLTILLCSIPVLVYVWATEGFIQGKAYMFIVTMMLGAWGYGFRKLFFWKK